VGYQLRSAIDHLAFELVNQAPTATFSAAMSMVIQGRGFALELLGNQPGITGRQPHPSA